MTTTAQLRSLGPEGLSQFLTRPGALDSPELDALCAQKDARHALLYWFTDFELARAEAQRTGKPMLVLLMLGRLDEELSCANSRFFRTTLYPYPEVAARLRQRFVLCWHPVRAVPVMRVDFGDGRVLTRTVTGNSAHLVLDSKGRPVDIIPGMHAPAAFLEALDFAHAVAREVAPLGDTERVSSLARHHRTARERLLSAWARAVHLPTERDPRVLERATTSWPALAGPVEVNSAPALLARKFPSAEAAGALAMTKRRVELPLLRALQPVENVIAEDTARNRLVLHRQVHEHFESRAPTTSWRALTDWLYETLLLMPLDDEWLGLSPDDSWAAIEGGGIER